MEKNIVKINENSLRQIVTESVKKILKETTDPNVRIKQLEEVIFDVGYDIGTLFDSLSCTYKGFEETELGDDLAEIYHKLDNALNGKISRSY